MQARQSVAVPQAEQGHRRRLCRLQQIIQQTLGGRTRRAGLGLLQSVCPILRTCTPSEL